jgi:cytochrome c oxidase assembly factor CtaG
VRSLRPVTNPFSCLAIVWIVVFGTHIPAFYDVTLRNSLLHDAEHALYLVTGLLMWWPVLDEDPLPSHRLSGFVRLGYLSIAMLPMTIIGVYLNRSTTLVYAPYAEPAHLLGISAIVDQQQAGAIMWVIGGTLMGAIGIWQAMAALIAEERRMQNRERLLERAIRKEELHG